jgi:hypothetical protein
MPEASDANCLKAAVLEKKIMGRIVSWQERQAVLTDSLLALGRRDEGVMLDCILLHEITTVRYVIDHEADEAAAAEVLAKAAKEAQKDKRVSLKHAQSMNNPTSLKRWSDDDFAILITTDPDGNSAGRSYILRADSLEERNAWHDAIERQVKAACKAFSVYVETKEVMSAFITVESGVPLESSESHSQCKRAFAIVHAFPDPSTIHQRTQRSSVGDLTEKEKDVV